MSLLPTNTFVSGDLWSWNATSSDYPANLYTLRYIFKHVSNKTSHATVSSTPASNTFDHVISLSGTNTATLVSGEYQISVQAIDNATSDVVTVEQGTVLVQPNPMDFNVTSKWQAAIEALEASLIADTSSAVLEYEVLGRKIKRMNIQDRKEALNYCKHQLRREQGKTKAIKSIPFLFIEY